VSTQAPAPPAKAKANNKDCFGLPPVEKGHVRGRVANLRRSSEVSAFGELVVLDFDLVPCGGAPPVPVLMRGTYLEGDIRPDYVMEVRDPDPSVRPILARELRHAHHRRQMVTMHYPGTNKWPTYLRRGMELLLLIGPLMLIAVLLALYYTLLA
jgi:hypothetical protein